MYTNFVDTCIMYMYTDIPIPVAYPFVKSNVTNLSIMKYLDSE